MPVQAYIGFEYQCEEAVNFYADVFENPSPQFMRYKDQPSPDYPLTDSTGNLILHAKLIIEGDTVMFGDIYPGMKFTLGNNISLTVVSKDKEKTRRYFEILKIGGVVKMELQETFWSPLYGNLSDKYGIEWQFSTTPEPAS